MLRNSDTAFGSLSKCLHWAGAVLIFGMIGLGVLALKYPLETPDQMAAKWQLFALHKTIGVCAFGFGALRLISMAMQVKPRPLSGHSATEVFVARVVHWQLTFLMMLVPLAGWVRHAALPGFAPLYLPFGNSLPFVPADPQLSEYASMLHFGFVALLTGAVLLHIMGALKHHIADRDVTLRRMLPGSPACDVQKAPKKAPSLLVALGLILAVAVVSIANTPEL